MFYGFLFYCHIIFYTPSGRCPVFT
jgi:hypothetical protein